MGYFHNIANGRKRRCIIESLEEGGRVITEQKEPQEHIEQYYKMLFGKETRNEVKLDPRIWQEKGNLNTKEKQLLIDTFTIEEVETALNK